MTPSRIALAVLCIAMVSVGLEAATAQSDNMAPHITAPTCFIETAGEGTPTAPNCAPSTAISAKGESIPVTETMPLLLEPGLYQIVVAATDSDGNSAFTTRFVLVGDTTPTLETPASYVKEATGLLTPISESDYGSLDASDPASGLHFQWCTVPDQLPVGEPKPYSCMARDTTGNIMFKEFTIEITDTTPPTCTSSRIPTYIEARAPQTQLIRDDANINESDVAGGPLQVTTNTKPIKVDEWRIVLWTVTDDQGLSTTCTQSVIVDDTTAPSFPDTLPDIIIESSTSVSVWDVELTPPDVTDAGESDPFVYHEETGMFELGENTVTWLASDRSANRSSAEQMVIVRAP